MKLKPKVNGDMPWFSIGSLDIVQNIKTSKNITSPKLIHRFGTASIKTSTRFFIEIARQL